MATTLDQVLHSLPAQFWLLLLGCAVGFALLWWWTLGHRRWQRRRLLHTRLAELGHGAADSPPAAQPPAGTAPGTSDALHPRFLFVGDAAANVAGLLQAGGALPQKETASTPWQAWTQPAMTAIAPGPGIAEDTADSGARSLWLQGLLTLAEQRPALPLNGVVVCVAAQALPQAPRRLAALVQEAAQLLQLQLPVYVVVTGLERLQGYAEVRAGLQPEVLAQALGHCFIEPDAGSGGGAPRLDALFAPLSARLQALGMALVRDQPDPAARLAILRWIEQVVALQAGLAALADRLFAPGAGAPWRGLYLTAAASEADQGAFATDLFQRFLPDDQSLARPARHLR
ncbi:type VI secretion system protein [Variovorax fucosicus]|uniref:type VI secretion system protein n=1 Tax=Variovorax fucosicus TaxID=3053517 RepID=UPI002575FEF4|nr:type VI secretion system protein [Variovorax sp. J22G47]MDM0054657.1 type VI secretion system protein [Variovorax sp. J22G47]